MPGGGVVVARGLVHCSPLWTTSRHFGASSQRDATASMGNVLGGGFAAGSGGFVASVSATRAGRGRRDGLSREGRDASALSARSRQRRLTLEGRQPRRAGRASTGRDSVS